MQNIVLWLYIALLLAGGLIGFFKGKSRVSLVTSVSFAAILILCALDIVFKRYVADIVMVVLLVVFTLRLTRTKKFMPAGLMLVVTVAALMIRNLKF
jgi:uncharacterized membrane protein (UPF0136 family)